MRQVFQVSYRFAAGLLWMAMLGCGGKLTPESFEKVQTGMTTEQVQGLLGGPTRTSASSLPVIGDVTTYTYSTEKGTVTLIFHNDKLATKSGSVSQ